MTVTADTREILARALAGTDPELYPGAGHVFSNTTPREWHTLVHASVCDPWTGEPVKEEGNA